MVGKDDGFNLGWTKLTGDVVSWAKEAADDLTTMGRGPLSKLVCARWLTEETEAIM